MKHRDLKKKKRKRVKKIKSLSDVWGNIKWSNAYVNGITGGEEREKGKKTYLLVKK